MPEKCSCRLARAMGLSFDGQSVRMSGAPKIPFPFPKLNVWTLMGWYLPWLLREGQEMLGLWTMASWDVVAQSWDKGTPPAPVSQILGAVAWLSLLHRVSGTFLGSPELCCILGWVGVCGGTLKHPLGHTWRGHGLVGAGSAHPECATLPALPLVQLPRKLFQQPAKEETHHLLEQLFGASARRAAEGWEQLRRGQEQHGGTRSSGLGDGAVVTHPLPPGSRLNSGTCRQGFSLVLPTVLLPLRWRV